MLYLLLFAHFLSSFFAAYLAISSSYSCWAATYGKTLVFVSESSIINGK